MLQLGSGHLPPVTRCRQAQPGACRMPIARYSAPNSCREAPMDVAAFAYANNFTKSSPAAAPRCTPCKTRPHTYLIRNAPAYKSTSLCARSTSTSTLSTASRAVRRVRTLTNGSSCSILLHRSHGASWCAKNHTHWTWADKARAAPQNSGAKAHVLLQAGGRGVFFWSTFPKFRRCATRARGS